MTRVLVAASSAVTRAGLAAILAREPAFTIVGGGKAAALADDVAEHDPDVVLVELAASDEEMLATLHTVSIDTDDDARPAPAVVVLTDERDPAHALDALRLGIRAVLPRDAGSVEIVAAVSAAAAGLVVVAQEWAQPLRGALGAERSAPSAERGPLNPESLTPREVEVLRLIAEGLGNKQIAARLAISEHTVKFHVGSVFAKIRASTRAEAVMIGARRGLIVV